MSTHEHPSYGHITPPSLSIRTALQAIDTLRRGWAIVVYEPGMPQGLVCLSTEVLTEGGLADLRSIGPVYMALTRERAATLKVGTAIDPAVLIPVHPSADTRSLRAIGDPTLDLARPLQGPFKAHLCADLGISQETAQTGLDVLKAARLLPAAVMALAPDISAIPDLLPRVQVKDIAALYQARAHDLAPVVETIVQLEGAEDCRVVVFRPDDGSEEHLALVIGSPDFNIPTLVRVHSSCLTGDIFGSLRCDCGPQLRGAIQTMAQESGVILYLQQEGRGIGFLNKMRAYTLQHQGFDTVDANERLGFTDDERSFAPASRMLRHLGISQVRLLTNNPQKVAALEAFDVTVTERVPHSYPSNPHNAHYLDTKARRSGHYLPPSTPFLDTKD